jgi:hypothetical protein
MKYVHVYALSLLSVFCTSCGGQNKPDLPKENIKSETKDVVTSPGSNETYHTKYEYTDSIGKSLIIQYGGATNIFSTFCSLVSFDFRKRITPTKRQIKTTLQNKFNL